MVRSGSEPAVSPNDGRYNSPSGRNRSTRNGDSTVIKQALCAATLCFAATLAHGDVILTEGFNNVATLGASGWVSTNNSNPVGAVGWEQGNTGVFDAQSGAANSFVAASFLNSSPLGGAISNWLISPEFTLFNGETISFYTRSSGFLPDNLEVRLSGAGSSTDVGAASNSVGDFSALLAVLNPAFAPDGYPTDWTLISLTVSGVVDGSTGRFAFRYFIPDSSANGDYIGIDNVSVTTPEPETFGLFALGLLPLWLGRRARRAK